MVMETVFEHQKSSLLLGKHCFWTLLANRAKRLMYTNSTYIYIQLIRANDDFENVIGSSIVRTQIKSQRKSQSSTIKTTSFPPAHSLTQFSSLTSYLLLPASFSLVSTTASQFFFFFYGLFIPFFNILTSAFLHDFTCPTCFEKDISSH